jgi:hypothetical protein
MARVKAIETGYDGVAVRKKGDVFEWNKPLAKWMEKVGGKAASDEPAEEQGSEHAAESEAPTEAPAGAKAPAKSGKGKK